MSGSPAPAAWPRGRGSTATSEAGDAPSAVLVPCRLFLPVVPAARVIGKGGANLRAIRAHCGADVRILQKELPREMQAREDRVVAIEGHEAEAVKGAIVGVLERVFDRSGLPEGARASRTAERPHVVEILVPEKSGSHFVGQGGERARRLIEETGCDIYVGRDLAPGLAGQKKVRVTGANVEEAAGAVWRLQELLGELAAGGVLRPEHFELREARSAAPGGTSGSALAPRLSGGSGGSRETPIRLLVSKEEAAWIVGKKGNKIMRLRDHARVHMNDADAPPFDASERVLEIAAAPLERRLRALRMALEDLATRETCSELRLLVPTRDFGSVMGHRGETMRAIMARTGVRLQQHKAEQLESGEYHLRLVEVQGDSQQRCDVVRLVHEAIEDRGSAGGKGAAARVVPAPAPASLLPIDAPVVAPRSPGGGSSTPAAGRLIASGLIGAASAATPPPTTAPPLELPSLGDECGGQMSLQLAVPSEEVARLLADEASGIAWRAGVKLSVERGPSGIPILQSTGTAVGNSVACYLIQDRLFMMH